MVIALGICRLQDQYGGVATRSEDPNVSLARAAAQGDQKALQALLRVVGPSMSAVLRRMIPASAHEDAVQEALIALVRALPSFRFESSVKHFACRVAVRSGTVFSRTRFRRGRADDLGRLAHELHPPSATPLDDAVLERRRQLVADLCASLPPEQAETLTLRVVLGYTLQEVSEATGAPVNTVRSRVRLAKEALRKRIEADPELEESLEIKAARGGGL